MKIKPTRLLVVLCALCVAQVLPAQTSPGTTLTSRANSNTQYHVVKRNLNSRVWERTETVETPDGRQVSVTNSYTELATGLCYEKGGQLVDSKAEIKILPNGAGAAASEGQHKVVFPANLYDGQIELNTPDNKWFRSHVLGLAYYDTATGESVLLAETTNSAGQLYSSNVVIYADAFSGIKADVRYTYTPGAFEQDIVLRSRLPSPADYGLDPETTRLEVLTEFFNPPTPVKETQEIAGIQDQQLDFGVMKIGRGKGFALGNEANSMQSVPVTKSWEKIEGRDILFEDVEFKAVEAELNKLPRSAMNNVPATPDSEQQQATKSRTLPAPRTAGNESTDKFLVAKADVESRPGYVLDYVTTPGSVSSYTFHSDTTYYISGEFNIYGPITLEGGTVIKFAANPGQGLVLNGPLDCETSLYRPAVFTSKDDDSVGERIADSSGWPSTFNGTALDFDIESSVTALEHIRIAYAARGIEYSVSPGSLRHCQFVNVAKGVLNYSSPLTVDNVLFHNVSVYAFGTDYEVQSTYNAWHLTVHNSPGTGVLTSAGATLNVFNSLFANAPDGGDDVNKTACMDVSDSAFTTRGAGYDYVTDPAYRNNTVSVSADLLRDFKKMTTEPPTEMPPQTISAPATWYQTVARETSLPLMRGYHYPALDYLVSQVNVQNTTLTLGEGVAVAAYGACGLQTYTGGTLITHGTALSHNQLCFYPAVQEQPMKLADVLPGTLLVWYGYNPPSKLDAQFTDFSGMAGTLSLAYGYSFQCQLRDCYVGPGLFEPNSPSTFLSFINNLFERVNLHIGTFDFICPLDFYNNTAINSIIQIDNDGGADGYRTVRDNLYDHSTNSVAYPQYVAYDHNARFASYTTLMPPHTGDRTLFSRSYATGPLGNRYIASSTPTLVNAGSRSAYDAGLDHDYTILPDQTRDGAGGNGDPVDVGFHYYVLDQPSAYDVSGLQVCKSDNVLFELSGSSPNSPFLSYTVLTQPQHGSLSDTPPNLTYTETDPNFLGQDTFTYKVNDGYLDSLPATVTITVGDPNPHPNDQDVMVGVNTAFPIDLSASSDCSDPLNFVTDPTTIYGLGDLDPVIPGDATHASVTYRPGSSEGADGFHFTVAAPGFPPSPVGTVTINIVAAPQQLRTDCRQHHIALHWSLSPYVQALDQIPPGYIYDFQIYRCEGGGCTPTEWKATVGPNARSWADTDVVEGRTYCYAVTFRHRNMYYPDRTPEFYESPPSAPSCNQLCSTPGILITGNQYSSGGIATYDFTDGTLVNSFATDVNTANPIASDGRGLAIYNGKIYYTDLSDPDTIHVCPYGTEGSGGHDIPSASISSPANGGGIQDLAFAVDPANMTNELFILAGYPNQALVVYEVDPATGNQVSDGTIHQGGLSIPSPATSSSDGFTILPDGNFLINDGDGQPTYREYSSSNGILVSPPTGLEINLANYGFYIGTGVCLSPDRQSLYFMAGTGTGSGEPPLDTLVNIRLSDLHVETETIGDAFSEDIDVVIP